MEGLGSRIGEVLTSCVLGRISRPPPQWLTWEESAVHRLNGLPGKNQPSTACPLVFSGCNARCWVQPQGAGLTGIRAGVRRSPGPFIKHKDLLFFPFFFPPFLMISSGYHRNNVFFWVPNFRFLLPKKSGKFWGNVFTSVILTKFANIWGKIAPKLQHHNYGKKKI